MNYDIELEQAIIGRVILNNNHLGSLFFLKAEDFYEPAHQRLFAKICKLVNEENSSASTFTMKQFFSSDEDLKKAGGVGYLKIILDSASSILDLKDAAKSLRNLAILRELSSLGQEINEICGNGAKNPQEIKDLINERLEAISQPDNQKEPRQILDIVRSVVEKAAKPRKDLLKFGYKQFDEILGGVYEGALVILAGRTGMGKSAFGLNLAANVAEKLPVVLFSLEMGDEQFGSRLLTNIASINSYRLRNGWLNENENRSIAQNADRISKLDLTIDDTPAVGLSYIRYRLKRLSQKKKLGLVVIDHLHIMKTEGKHQSREREIGSISEGLKRMAREFNVPIVLLAQLNRATDKRNNRKPILSDLRDSGSIEQDADIVVFVHRDDYYLQAEKPHETDSDFKDWQAMYDKVKGKAVVMVAKNRDGATDEVNFNFNIEFSRFTETNNFNL